MRTGNERERRSIHDANRLSCIPLTRSVWRGRLQGHQLHTSEGRQATRMAAAETHEGFIRLVGPDAGRLKLAAEAARQAAEREHVDRVEITEGGDSNSPEWVHRAIAPLRTGLSLAHKMDQFRRRLGWLLVF